MECFQESQEKIKKVMLLKSVSMLMSNFKQTINIRVQDSQFRLKFQQHEKYEIRCMITLNQYCIKYQFIAHLYYPFYTCMMKLLDHILIYFNFFSMESIQNISKILEDDQKTTFTVAILREITQQAKYIFSIHIYSLGTHNTKTLWVLEQDLF